MEGIIGVKEANCKNCYKCIRNCSVKSMTFKEEQVRIIGDECIYCGTCLLICPQKAKYICSDLPKVQKAIQNHEKLYVSVAPSYVAAFPNTDFFKFAAALKKLGFTQVEETAIGAERVSRQYEKLMQEKKMKNIITTSCPSVNLLVEKYYPELVPQLAPVVSPLLAHTRMMKEIYGKRAKIVFIGPCVSKKYESLDPDNAKAIFAVLTFEELKQWLMDENIEFTVGEEGIRALRNPLPRYYPAPGGIIRNIRRDIRRNYECLSVDGIDRCIAVFESIVRDGLTGYFLEMNACIGGCLGGPILKSLKTSFLTSKEILFKNAAQANEALPALTEGIEARFEKKFKNRSVAKEAMDEEKIKEILISTGKLTPDMELNCGCCGYNTCREKAIAVLQNKADIRMCLPYMRELAESMSNTVVENIPIGILIINDRLEIEHVNPAGLMLLKVAGDIKGRKIVDYLPSEDFRQVLMSGENILNHKQKYEQLNITVEQTVIFVERSKLMFVLLKDITSHEKMLEAHQKVTEETTAFAQEVINKQIQAVQEIANLLSQTTTETKIALSKLTKALASEEGD